MDVVVLGVGLELEPGIDLPRTGVSGGDALAAGHLQRAPQRCLGRGVGRVGRVRDGHDLEPRQARLIPDMHCYVSHANSPRARRQQPSTRKNAHRRAQLILCIHVAAGRVALRCVWRSR